MSPRHNDSPISGNRSTESPGTERRVRGPVFDFERRKIVDCIIKLFGLPEGVFLIEFVGNLVLFSSNGNRSSRLGKRRIKNGYASPKFTVTIDAVLTVEPYRRCYVLGVKCSIIARRRRLRWSGFLFRKILSSVLITATATA